MLVMKERTLFSRQFYDIDTDIRHGRCDCYLNIYERGKDVSSHKGWQVFGVLTLEFWKWQEERGNLPVSINGKLTWIESFAPIVLKNKAKLKLCKLTNLTLALNIHIVQ